MSEQLLREYLKEALLAELHVDKKFLSHLRRTAGLNDSSVRPSNEEMNQQALRVAESWIEQIEDELGHGLRHNHSAVIKRFVLRRWPGILVRFRGNVGAAEQTMYNVLDSKFNSLRVKVD